MVAEFKILDPCRYKTLKKKKKKKKKLKMKLKRSKIFLGVQDC